MRISNASCEDRQESLDAKLDATEYSCALNCHEKHTIGIRGRKR